LLITRIPGEQQFRHFSRGRYSHEISMLPATHLDLDGAFVIIEDKDFKKGLNCARQKRPAIDYFYGPRKRVLANQPAAITSLGQAFF
jgi:hypothetical protein